MKINKLFMGLAAIAFVGCSSDDLNVIAPEQAVEDARLVELDPNFVIAGVGAEASGTRTHWEMVDGKLVNKFLPIYNAAGAANTKLNEVDLKAQQVGLCWLGNGAVGTDVYTNYQFYHFGWLNNDETKADVECDKLNNGAFYSDLKLADAVNKDDEAKPEDFAYIAGEGIPEDDLNFNSGVYKTDNKSIFGGDYIVYYPFNEDFKNAGTIPAIAETEFNPASTEFTTPELGEATFRYSDPVNIKGGDQAADFALHNLSALVQLKVFSTAGDGAMGRKVDQIVLYSASKQLLKQANLAADKIVAGQTGADLYASTEGTKTISATFKTAVELKVKAEAAKGAFITVLPTTVSDLQVLVHTTDALGDNGKWATIDMGNTEFKAGSAKVLNITVTAADLKDDYIAVDKASLLTALKEARVVATDADHTATIKVMGDITLNKTEAGDDPETLFMTHGHDAFITITGDDIIVPEDMILKLKTNMVSDVRVLGKSCCDGKQGGRLEILGGTVNNVTMEETEAKTKSVETNPKVTYSDAATIAAGKTFDVQAGTVEVNAAVAHKGDIKIAKGANIIVMPEGRLNFMGSSVVNDGTIEVKKAGKFDMTDSDGNATADDGKRMTNNGTFIHNVDAVVGTAVQKMNQNGEYRCKVDDQIKLDDAYLQWKACSVIEIVGAGVEYNLVTGKAVGYKHNGKYIDIEVNADDDATTFINKITEAPLADDEVINIGSLKVKKGGLTIQYGKQGNELPNKKLHYRTLNVNGDMVVKATTEIESSQKITVTENLTVDGATLTYYGPTDYGTYKLKNVDGLAVAKDITVSDGFFDASQLDALNITCANFYLEKDGIAEFGNRTDGAAKNLVVSGTISNPKDCTFNILPAAGGNVLAWITCSKLMVGGNFPGGQPRVE